jgi:hypothetical protein
MDPYLEASHIWEDFHAEFASEIRAQMALHLRPNYFAALNPMVTYEETYTLELYRIKPDVGVVRFPERPGAHTAVAIAPAPLIGQAPVEIPIRSYSLEIHLVQGGTLVTAIEILSPVNKQRGHKAFEQYHRKRLDLMSTGVHVLELDLLRAGVRPPLQTPLPDAPYFILLTRRERYPRVEIWPLSLQQPLPVVPVPLQAPDPDVPLDLGQALRVLYDRAGYDLRLDYSQPPPPPALSPEEAAWLDEHLRQVGARPPAQGITHQER